MPPHEKGLSRPIPLPSQNGGLLKIGAIEAFDVILRIDLLGQHESIQKTRKQLPPAPARPMNSPDYVHLSGNGNCFLAVKNTEPVKGVAETSHPQICPRLLHRSLDANRHRG